MKTIVWVTEQFVGFHRWKDAPDEVAFLREWHRHIFHVRLAVEVGHNNREVEFFLLKRQLGKFLQGSFNNKQFEYSCEQIAEMICDSFNAYSVEVSEDGENGATVFASVASKLRTRCFVGIEAEGPHRGQVALFVPGSVSPDRFLACLANSMATAGLARLYYGAGNDRELRRDTLTAVLDAAAKGAFHVDIETTMLSALTDHAQGRGASIILYGKSPKEAALGRVNFFKYVKSGVIFWEEPATQKVYTTSMNDPLFEKDTFVE